MMRFFRVYGLSCVVTLTILYLCIARTLPVENVPKFEGIDKVVHFLMYVGLAGALCLDHYRQRISFSSFRMYAWAILFPVLYGGFIEIVQGAFFPPRSAEWADWFCDVAGTLVGFFLAKLIYPKVVRQEDGACTRLDKNK
ncbi:MAG: VanZ family protein [Paludibacteraceae bacterium]